MKTTKEMWVIEYFDDSNLSNVHYIKEHDGVINPIRVFSQYEVDKLKKKIISLESDIETSEMIIEDNKRELEQLRQELKGRIRIDFFSIFFPNEKDNKEFFIEIEDLIDSVFAKYGVGLSTEDCPALGKGQSAVVPEGSIPSNPKILSNKDLLMEGKVPSNPNNIHCNMCHSYGRDCSTPDDECCRLLEKHHIQE